MIHFEVVNEFLGLKVPNEEGTGSLGLVAADEKSAVVRDEQRIEESILAHFERRHTVAILQTD